MSATGGGLLAICDFVGSDKSLQFATGLLARGGKVVVTGLLGGNADCRRRIRHQGDDHRGHADRHARRVRAELLDPGARVKNIAPIPTRNQPLNDAQAALDDLRAGRIVGRTVLTG